MKSCFLALSILVSANAFAAPDITACRVSAPKFRELEDGVNRQTICEETVYAIRKSYVAIPPTETLTIAVGDRTTYSLLLWIVWTTPYSGGGYQGHGVMSWSPDGASVTLLDK